LDELAAADLQRLTDAELADAVAQLHVESARLAAVVAGVVGAWDARQVWKADRSKSAAAALARDCRLAKGTARAELRRARQLRHLPATRDALAAGTIGLDQVDELVRVRNPRTQEALARDEALLVDQACRLSFAQYHLAVTFWSHLADPDGTDQAAIDRRDRRGFRLVQTMHGEWLCDGRFDPVAGTILRNALRHIERALFHADRREAREAAGGASPDFEDLARTPAQRQADALVEMATRALSATGPRPVPLFSVFLGHPKFEHVLQTAGGIPLTPADVEPWLDGSQPIDVERVVFGSDSRVIDLGRRSRLFRGGARRAIELRDQNCTFPGCDTPAEDCDCDHEIPWQDGGRTDHTNGRLRCPTHNRLKRTA
jgi:hypothetical protein